MKLIRYLLLLCLLCPTFAYAQRPLTIVGGVVTANVADTNDFQVILTANVTGVTLTSTTGTSNNAVTPATGYQITMRFVQDATGSRTVTFGGNITTACSINSTALAVTICRFQYTASGNTWADAGGSSSSTSSPSSAYTFYPVSGTSCAAQNYSPSGTFYCAFPGLPNGNPTYSGTDFAVVFNNVTTLLATVGGKLTRRVGIYNINSLTNESATGCSNFDGSGKQLSYGLAFPANTIAASVQWILDDEAMPLWQGEALTATVNNSGVILNITPTAVASVTANNILAGTWQRPSTNCTLSPTNASNEIHYKNMAVRFPVNTRGNEIAFASYFAEAVEYENVTADFNVSYNTLATGAAPTKGSYGSFGLTTTVSSASNYQYFRNVFSSGYDIAYDFQSEHVIGETVTAIYSNFACEFGRSGTAVFHPSWINHFVDQENGAGCIWGPQMIQASAVDIYFDFEFGNDGNWYTTARGKTGKLTETNCNIGTGIIRYGVVLQNVGSVAEVPGPNLFTTCGANFDFQEVAQPLNYARSSVSDSFTRPDATQLGPAWNSNIQGGTSNFRITSNKAVPIVNGAAAASWVSQLFTADQFGKVTVSAVTATTAAAVLVRASTSAQVQTYYEYACSTGAGGLITQRGLYRVIGGAAAVNIANTAAASTGCSNGDALMVYAIGSTLIAYYCPAAVCNNTPDMIVTDTNITSGEPGILATGTGVTLSNFSGGSLPLASSLSIYNSPAIAPTYATLSNCSSSGGTCVSAAAGSVSIAAAATTVTVATTAVTANSQIILTRDDTLGTKLSVTCNTATAAGDIKVSTRTAGTSFVITVQNAPAANPLCLNYWIVN